MSRFARIRGLHFGAVGWWGGACGWPGLSGVVRRAAGVVRRGLEVPGLPGLAAVAGWLRLSVVWLVGGWRAADRRWRCAGCDRRVSATAGTIFHKTRTPLTVWFAAAWQMTSGKIGISATQLQRGMGLGSYQTAWAMLHRYRSVMVRPGRDRLSGDVEVDESFLGGPEPGVPGRGALGKVQFAAAVELAGPRGFGRARLAIIQDASAPSLRTFLLENVEPGGRVITDGWLSYPAATHEVYEHEPTTVSASGQEAHELLPAVHTVFSLVKRWVMGTLQGSVSPEHLQAVLRRVGLPLQPPPLAQPRAAVSAPDGTGCRWRRDHLQGPPQGRTDTLRSAASTRGAVPAPEPRPRPCRPALASIRSHLAFRHQDGDPDLLDCRGDACRVRLTRRRSGDVRLAAGGDRMRRWAEPAPEERSDVHVPRCPRSDRRAAGRCCSSRQRVCRDRSCGDHGWRSRARGPDRRRRRRARRGREDRRTCHGRRRIGERAGPGHRPCRWRCDRRVGPSVPRADGARRRRPALRRRAPRARARRAGWAARSARRTGPTQRTGGVG